MHIWQWHIFPRRMICLWIFENNWLRCLLTTHIRMIWYVEVHQIPERYKYHPYWRLHLHMLLNTMEKRDFTAKYKYQKYICHWSNCKKCIWMCWSCSPGIWMCKYHYRMHVRQDASTKHQIGLESAWWKTWWPIIFLFFFVVCTEVNAYLAMKYSLKTDDKLWNFKKIG